MESTVSVQLKSVFDVGGGDDSGGGSR